MSDPALVREILRQVYGATRTILIRFDAISKPADFTKSEAYFDLDPEVVFTVCKKHIAPLGETVRRIAQDLEQDGGHR